MNAYRRTTQALAPDRAPERVPGRYALHPSHPLPGGRIGAGFGDLAAWFPEHGLVVLDGDPGILWEDFRARLDAALRAVGRIPVWRDVRLALRGEGELEARLAPYLGAGDPVFGRRYDGSLLDFFVPEGLAVLGEGQGEGEPCGPVVVYGSGAALVSRAPGVRVLYVELPRNEQQFRARAGVPVNLGRSAALPPKPAYQRAYFVDWPAMDAHKKSLSGRVDLVIDGQRPESPSMVGGGDLRRALEGLAAGGFRVRPWFEPGPWGGQWCRRHIAELPPAPNYAWSFELIAPENGITFRDADGRLLEVSLTWLMQRHAAGVLGEAAAWFGDEFPIRFDFLDTVEGGNLSVQVHPSPEYIRTRFGERFTQDETYYILDAAPGATVNLGFQAGVRAEDFREALERSLATATPMDMERWVQSFPARRGDLFLIPHGTVHGAGTGNLVLEISATPYIFTFKLHDWLRPDLDGRPRPLNIERGMANLDFTRAGPRVGEEFVSRPREIGRAPDGTRLSEELPTHADHFYEVRRHRFRGELELETAGSVQVLSLVEGTEVELEVGGRPPQAYSFAETFVVAAAAGRFRLRTRDGEESVVVQARMKPRASWPAWMSAVEPAGTAPAGA